VWIYRYRQRRWHRLVRNHLLPAGPRYSPPADTWPAAARHRRTR